ncbi:accessory gland protein Acp62F-like [Drosophila obscura]|uniref:accessory gland protein Acp62F-like n=1 Tax=Drosophila obscura TaxID=7282 RepID=UPI000BA13C44|nr:accessory gland protein Acp62F-like [Drosophila obscura]
MMLRVSLLLWLLLLLLPALVVVMEMSKVLVHESIPDPDRDKYIWNPFPGFCGPNATMVHCGGVCPETCLFQSLSCPTHCGVPCQCKPGYVFAESQLLCILRSDCSPHDQQQKVATHRVFQ